MSDYKPGTERIRYGQRRIRLCVYCGWPVFPIFVSEPDGVSREVFVGADRNPSGDVLLQMFADGGSRVIADPRGQLPGDRWLRHGARHCTGVKR